METEIIVAATRRLPLCGAALLLVLYGGLLPPGARAQTSLGDIRGEVVAQVGGPLPGVTVALTSGDSRVVRRTRTDANGVFVFPGLPPGTYEVAASLEGYASQRQEDLHLAPGAAILSRLELRKALLPETIALAPMPSSMEPLRTDTGTAVSSVEIAHLPLQSRDPLDFTMLGRGANTDLLSAEGITSGMPASMNRLLVDGAIVPMPRSAAPDEWSRAAHRLARELTSALQVVVSGAPAQAGGAAGLVAVAATPAGSDRFTTEIFERYRAPGLRGSTVEPGVADGTRTASSAHQFGGTLGGPVASERHFFFVGYDGLRERDENLVAMNLPGGLPSDAATAAGVSRLASAAGSWRRSSRQDLLVVRTDHRIADAHLMTVRYGQRLFSGTNTEHAGPRVAEDATGPTTYTTRSIAVSAGSSVRTDLFNDFRFQYARSSDRGSGGTGPRADVYASGGLALRTGGSMDGPRDDRAHRVHAADVLTWTRGRHLLDAGLEVEIDRVRHAFASGLQGAYVFRAPGSFAGGAVVAPGDTYTQSFVAAGLTGLVTEPHSEVYTGFVQDAWHAFDALTLEAGLRYSRQRFPGGGAERLGAALGQASGRAPGFESDGGNWAPRVGVVWAPSPRLVARASYGLAYGRTPVGLISAAQAYNGTDVYTLALGPADAPPLFPDRLTVAPAAARPSLVVVADETLRSPRLRQLGLGVEWEWMRNTSLSVTYVNARGDHLPVAEEANVGAAAPVALTVAGTGEVIPALRFAPGLMPLLDRVVRIRSGATTYDGITVELRRRLTAGLDVRMAYTGSRAVETGPLATSLAFGSPRDRIILQAGASGQTPADTDQRQRFLATAVLFTDNFASRFDGLFERVLDDWRLGALYMLEGGRPYTAYVDMDLGGDGNRYNDVAPGTSRNAFRAPKEGRLDVSAAREIPLPGRVRVLAGVEVFNVLNAAHYREIDTTLYTVSGNVLLPNPHFGQRFHAKAPRVLQLNVSLRF